MIVNHSPSSVEILVVEDSATQAEQLRYILEQHGYDVTVARNGREALAALRTRARTLVVSDVVMPEMDGYTLCSHIKRDDRIRDIPVILLTSLSDPADVVRGLESGADSFIFKPYDEQYLLARISYILANQHLRANDSAQMGVEVFFAGRKFFITSDRLQILNLLLSTYEAAVQKNRELAVAQDELQHLNQHLEIKVAERTAALSTEVEVRRLAQEGLQSQLSRLNLLHRITRAIGERQDLTSIFQVVIRSLEDDLPIDFACICQLDDGARTLSVARVGVRSAVLARALAAPDHAGIDIERNGFARSLLGELLHEPNLAVLPYPFAERLASTGLCSMVAAPLQVEGKVFGILIAARTEGNAFSSGDCEFLRQVSDHVALAAHQMQLHGALQHAYDELRETQKAVMQQERLRALGQMASGVAHDINNAISPVVLYTEALLEQEPNLSEQARRQLVTIQRAVDDVAQTVARMREFYRPCGRQFIASDVDLNSLVQHVIELTHVRWSAAPQERGIVITLDTALAPDLPLVSGVEGEIRDALTNLVFNAVDAMPDGGLVRIGTRIVAARNGSGNVVDAVCVEVSDTGVGMDEETRRRCLEPFFTTKGERGSGLGLAMVYGMAQRHDADLEIDSAPERGTVVRLIMRVAQASTPTVDRAAARAPVRALRILLVDDDPLVLESLRDSLERDGHVITSADGGQAAIHQFTAAQARGELFDAVITDLGMPYIDGRKVAAAVKQASPSTPLILLTGWGHRLAAENDNPPHVDRILNKPPKLNDLRVALAELVSQVEEPARTASDVA